MRRLGTVRVRITLAAVAVVGASLAGGGAWLVVTHRASLTRDAETAAQLRALDVAASIRSGDLRSLLAAPPGDQSAVQVIDSAGRVVSASANIDGEPRMTTLDPGSTGHAARTVGSLPVAEGQFRVVANRVATKSATYTVYVATSLEPARDGTRDLVKRLAVGLPVLLVLVGAVTWVVTRRALRPVEAIRREVEVIGAHALDRRVPEPTRQDEIGRLARTMNAMLERLQRTTDRQRQFVADASHELRSPLTDMRARLEVNLAHPETADWVSTERDVLDDAIRLQRLVDDLLTLARADTSSIPSGRASFDLDEVVLSEARRLRARTPIAVDTSGVSGAQLTGSREDLGRAVRNLLDNAARHARSTVTVTLAETDTAVTLTVADDGSGVPPAARERVFERFTRLDEARTRDRGGAGLGLAIVHDIVSSHGGTISVENAPGARFTVSLPVGGTDHESG